MKMLQEKLRIAEVVALACFLLVSLGNGWYLWGKLPSPEVAFYAVCAGEMAEQLVRKAVRFYYGPEMERAQRDAAAKS